MSSSSTSVWTHDPALVKPFGSDSVRQLLAVNEPSDALLHLLIGKRLLLADQQHRLVGKLRAAVHRSHHCVDEIVPVQIGLAAVR